MNLTAPRPRIDWKAIRDGIDLAAVVAALLGPAAGRRGGQGRLWWRCPLGTHIDANPSFAVDPTKRTWRCYGCGESGDAAALVMKLRQCKFPEAVTYLAGNSLESMKPIGPRPSAPASAAGASHRPADESSGLTPTGAAELVEAAAGRLWTPEGAEALGYLRGRGLLETTIKAARLGWTPGVTLPTSDGVRYWRASGVVIPWYAGDRLAMVKLRQPEGRRPKYVQAFRDRPTLYPRPETIRPGEPLVIVEGELDALLLGQELAELAAVVTLGSASARPEGSTYLAMLSAPAWYIATDADAAGDRAADGWPARTARVRPPAPSKDWTDSLAYGVNLRRWWTDRLGGIENPALFAWDELAQQRWGPAL